MKDGSLGICVTDLMLHAGREGQRLGRQRASLLSVSTVLIRSLITQGNGMPREKRGRDGAGKERRYGEEVGRAHASEWQFSKKDPSPASIHYPPKHTHV